jgi:tetratricopeptide (TPR) repeat protein
MPYAYRSDDRERGLGGSGERVALRSDVVPSGTAARTVDGLAAAALAYARAGDLDAARRAVGDAVLRLDEAVGGPSAAAAALDVGEALLLLGVPHYAKSHFEAALSLYEAFGDVWGAARARGGVGRALLAFGDPRGEELVELARATLEELGRRPAAG